jgi:hypothetical protein
MRGRSPRGMPGERPGSARGIFAVAYPDAARAGNGSRPSGGENQGASGVLDRKPASSLANGELSRFTSRRGRPRTQVAPQDLQFRWTGALPGHRVFQRPAGLPGHPAFRDSRGADLKRGAAPSSDRGIIHQRGALRRPRTSVIRIEPGDTFVCPGGFPSSGTWGRDVPWGDVPHAWMRWLRPHGRDKSVIRPKVRSRLQAWRQVLDGVVVAVVGVVAAVDVQQTARSDVPGSARSHVPGAWQLWQLWLRRGASRSGGLGWRRPVSGRGRGRGSCGGCGRVPAAAARAGPWAGLW